MKCEDCHWFKEENPYEIASNGKMYPCANIGVPGWECWAEEQKAPEECEDYCKRGEYVPTGIWAGVAKVVRAVEEMIEEDRKNAERGEN